MLLSIHLHCFKSPCIKILSARQMAYNLKSRKQETGVGGSRVQGLPKLYTNLIQNVTSKIT